jgi:hypothetical protein
MRDVKAATLDSDIEAADAAEAWEAIRNLEPGEEQRRRLRAYHHRALDRLRARVPMDTTGDLVAILGDKEQILGGLEDHGWARMRSDSYVRAVIAAAAVVAYMDELDRREGLRDERLRRLEGQVDSLLESLKLVALEVAQQKGVLPR